MGTTHRKYFGTDGIRDVAHEGLLRPDLVQAYGEAVGAWLAARVGVARVLVGRDPRESGPVILGQLAAGLLRHGHTLVDGGVLSTPAVQSLVRDEAFDLAIVISASHNPASDNGIKFFGSDGRKLSDDAEESLESLIEGAPPSAVVELGIRCEDEGAAERYLAALARALPRLDLSGHIFVLDCAHGAASAYGARALSQFGARVHVIGNQPDGTNINDGYGVFHVNNLGPMVRAHGATLGMALDGDADRVLLVDENGDVRDGDHMLGVLAVHLAKTGRLPGDCIVTTVMANMGLLSFLRERGLRAETVPVGDRHVAARMAEGGFDLGGEQSGHVIFREGPRWTGDGIYTALRILEAMQQAAAPLSSLTAGLVKFPQLLRNVEVREKPPVNGVLEVMDAVRQVEDDLGSEGRVVLRYSGTEPLLRVMVEARTEAMVNRSVELLVDVARRTLGA